MAKKPGQLEKTFENLLWQSRFIVIFGVIFGLLGSLALFITGSYDMILGLQKYFLSGEPGSSAKLIGNIVGVIDIYLIAIVILLFSFGIYELFISNIDIGHQQEELNILNIKDLDDLKNRILKVVVMVLVVSFFKQILAMKFSTSLEMLFLAISILALSLTTYFLRK